MPRFNHGVPIDTHPLQPTLDFTQKVFKLKTDRYELVLHPFRPAHGLEALRRVTSDALYSTGPFSSPSCHPGTRREALDILYEWAAELTPGAHGCRKSAILQTLTQRLHAAGRLGGSFVFCRKHETPGNAKAIFCAIAYQLAMNIPRLRAPISQVVRKNPAIFGESLSTQLEGLILAPCRALEAQQEILSLLGNAVQSRSSQLRILVSSRSGDSVARILGEPCFSGVCGSFYVQRSLEDVRTYLCAEFSRIQQNCFESSVAGGECVPWLSSQGFNHLVETSSGCFLYASTLIKFLGDPEFHPLARLAAVVETIPLNLLNCSLDRLYTQILATVPTGSRAALLAVLHILTTEKFADLPLRYMEQLLHMKAGRLRRILRHLRSVLNVPDSDSGGITAHHTSFLDFLADPARSGSFCVSGLRHSMYLVRCILKSLAYAHEKPRVNRVGHIAWNHLTVMVDYVTSVYPSPDLVPLVLRINPDFFFGSLSTFDELGGKILLWLNKMYPRPAEAIALWEDYEYMAFFHSTVNDFDFDDEYDSFSSSESKPLSHQVLLRCPALIRLLRVSMVLPALTPLFQFRVLDLACQSIRIAKGAYTGAVPLEMVGYWLEWGRYVRSSPPCAELLRELQGFVPRDDSQYGVATESEVYDVLKWFKSYPDAPQDEWLRWAGYLASGTKFEREFAFESRWTSWHGLRWCGR
ncbi:hypothetical protein FB451DRAFT_1364900 [Mycena latifolia]|nr:hypothetical protein FB451DRAFT_1364900 [Mycena latifolia]